MHPPVFIVILQYNNSQDTIECLDSVSKIGYPNFEAVVIDNASNSEHIENIRKFVESQGNTTLIENKENLGYSGGNNMGIEYALENGADYVLILNNDATVSPDILDKLVKVAESDPQIGIVSPLINEEGKIAYGGRIKWLSPELEHVYVSSFKFPADAKALAGRQVSSFYIPGVCMLVKKEVFEKVGMFDERYFLYFEDADYSIRAQKAGFKLAIAPDAVINHKVSASAKKLGSPLLLRYHMRNSLLFNWLHAPFLYKIFIPFWSVWVMYKQLVKFIFHINPQQTRAILDGIRDFYRQKWGQLNQ